MKTRGYLRKFLQIFLSFAFATLLLYYYPDRIYLFWPLYSIPILLAAYSYEVIGGLVVGLASAGALSWGMVRYQPLEASLDPFDLMLGIASGFLVIVLLGIVVGFLARVKKKEESLIKSLTRHDRLTGLETYSYFLDRLDEEVKKAQRYETHFCLIMLDIDDFRKFNEVFGHEKGNLMLQQMGRIIKKWARETDISARYGGEEFVILAPGTKKDAEVLADRIRGEIETTEFEGDIVEPKVKKTVSAGVIEFPDGASSDTELVVNVDRALRKAKSKGKNKVCIYSQEFAE